MIPSRLQQLAESARARARRSLLDALFAALERLLPPDRGLWCFCAWDGYPHTLDNPRAVFERVKDDPSIRKVVLTRGASPRRASAADGVNVRFVEAESILGAYLLARSGVVLLGYAVRVMASYGRRLTRKHLVVQLWHGIPLKRIGHLCPAEDWWGAETPLYAAAVSSSTRDREIMGEAFAPLPRERVWLTGLPRNDFLVGSEADLPHDYRAMLAELSGRIAGRRLVFYAPTWRDERDEHYAFSDAESAALDALLRAHGAVLGVRGHAIARGNAAYAREYARDSILNLNGVPDVNVVLRLADVLVTDYSSIYIDFLLTRRPIVHFVYDLERYQAGRGLLYDPGEAFAGPAARTFPELLARLEQAMCDPAASLPERERARRLFHSHAGHSARAVADEIRRLATGEAPARAPAAAAVSPAPALTAHPGGTSTTRGNR